MIYYNKYSDRDAIFSKLCACNERLLNNGFTAIKLSDWRWRKFLNLFTAATWKCVDNIFCSALFRYMYFELCRGGLSDIRAALIHDLVTCCNPQALSCSMYSPTLSRWALVGYWLNARARSSLTRARFLSLARSKLRLCSANHRAGYFSNLACDWLSTVWAYSEQETENGPRSRLGFEVDVNTLRLRHNCRHFAYDNFKCIFFNKTYQFRLSFTEVCSQGSNQQYVGLGSGNGLAQNKRQAIIWTNDG